MKRTTLMTALILSLFTGSLYAAEITLTGKTMSAATVNELHFDVDDFTPQTGPKGFIDSMSQGEFKFDRGYDDGYVGPAGYFQSDSIVTCSQPLVRIESLGDFNDFPKGENPFPTFGLASYSNEQVTADKSNISRVGFRLYDDKSIIDFSGLQNLQGNDKTKALASISDQFGPPSFVLKRDNGLRVLYFDKGVDAGAVQLAYENALDPQKKNNLLNITPSTVLYGVLLDNALNSDMGLKIEGDVLEFYIGDEYLVFTKYMQSGKFIDRINSVLENCDSAKDN